jgi:hypothetical protein
MVYLVAIVEFHLTDAVHPTGFPLTLIQIAIHKAISAIAVFIIQFIFSLR